MLVETKEYIMASEVKIESIFFCQFDPKEGPQITDQVPENKYTVISDSFHFIQNYLIPREELQQKLITVKAFGFKILGCPVHVKSPIYSRNAFIFNVCFVFKPNANTSCYEWVLKKLVQYFTVLEIESNYLSAISDGVLKEKTPTKEYYTSLKDVLEQVLHKLNTLGCCSIPIDEANTIHLKLMPSYDVPPTVRDHDVPLLTFELEEYHFQQWDLATQQILPLIDGFKHVSLIAAEAGKDVQLIKALIENLLYFKLVKIIPIFQYSNVYMVTSDIDKLYKCKELQQQFLRDVQMWSKDLPNFDSVIKVFSCFNHGTMATVKQVAMRLQPHKHLNIDIRKLIQFGVVHNFMRRIHKYPIRTAGSADVPPLDAVGSQIMKYSDGKHSYDEICCALSMSYEELEARIEENPAILLCWK